jgi:hypothetical protein
MFDESLFGDDKFWEILQYIDNSKENIPINKICVELDVKSQKIFEVITLLNDLNFNISIKNSEIHIPTEKEKIQLDLSISEWLSLQAHFPAMTIEHEKSFHQLISTKLGTIEKEHPELDLFKTIDLDRAINKAKKETLLRNYINTIETAIIGKHVVDILNNKNNSKELFPHRIIYLDKKLTIIGEEISDKNLTNLDLHLLTNINISSDTTYRPNFSQIEVNEFIHAIRTMNNKEERLILKIKTDQAINLTPKYHHFGTPYITTNSSGSQIWAGTVEKSDHLYSWLESIKESSTILGPESIQNELDQFIANKNQLKKIPA